MRRILISFFLSILLLKYASSDDCATTETLGEGQTCAGLTPRSNYKCEENPNKEDGQKPCIEVETCNILLPDGEITNGDRCSGRKKLNDANHCKEIIVDSETKCKEVPACQGAIPEGGINYNNCKDLWTDASSKKCVVADDGEGCKVAENCGDVKNGANANVCNLFTTQDSKCVVDGDECTPKTICGKETYVKGTTNCRDSVTDNDNLVCVDTGSKCESQTSCENVVYSASTDCSKLPTVDPSKICEKHKTDGKCVEATKPDNDEGTETKSSEGTETKSSEGTETKSSEGKETKSSGETGPTQGAETDLSKDNKGMQLNLSLYTLLIYFLF